MVREQKIRDAVRAPGIEGDLLRWCVGMSFNGKEPDAKQFDGIFDWFMTSEIGKRSGGKLYSHEEYARAEGRLENINSGINKALKRGEKEIARAGGIENVNFENMPELVKLKHAVVPVTGRFWVATKMLGGQKLWDDVTRTQARHTASLGAAAADVSHLVGKLRLLGMETYNRDVGEMRKLDANIKKLSDRIQARSVAKESGKWKDDGKDAELQSELNTLWEERKNMFSTTESSGQHIFKNKGASLNRDIVTLVEKSGLHENVYMQAVKNVAAKHGVSVNGLTDVVDAINTANKRFRVIGDETITFTKYVVENELNRMGATGEEIAEASDLIAKMGVVESGYFTRQAVINADPVSLVKTFKDMLDDVKSTDNPNDAMKLIREVLGEKSDFMKRRVSGDMFELADDPDAIDPRNYDIADIMKQYMSSMLHSNYVTKIHYITTEYLANFMEIARKNDNDKMIAYTAAMEKYMEHIRSKMIGTQSHGVGHNASSAILALSTAAALGAVRPAGTFKNAVEAQTQIMSKIGAVQYWQVASQLFRNEGGVRTFLTNLKEEYNVNLSSSVYWDGTASTKGGVGKLGLLADKQIAEMYATDEQRRASLAESSFKKFNEGSQWIADRSMVPWTLAENLLRGQAFDFGATRSINYVNREIAPLFSEGGYIPEIIIKKYDLERAKIDGSNAERMGELDKIRKAEAINGGLDFVHRTQMQYDALSRNSIEDVKTGGFQIGKLANLFRQYSLGQNTELALTAVNLYHEMKASPDWFKPTKAELKAGYIMNPKAAYITAMMSMAALGLRLADDKGILHRTTRFLGYWRSDPGEVGKFFADAMSKDPKKQEFANYGQSFMQLFQGPPASQFMWGVNMAVLSLMHERGDLPSNSQLAVQYITGINRDPKLIGFKEGESPYIPEDYLKVSARRFKNGISFWRDASELDLFGDTSFEKRGAAFFKQAFSARATRSQDMLLWKDKQEEGDQARSNPRNP